MELTFQRENVREAIGSAAAEVAHGDLPIALQRAVANGIREGAAPTNNALIISAALLALGLVFAGKGKRLRPW